MSLVGRPADNHPQQVSVRGARDDVDDRGTHPIHFAEFSREFGPFTLDVAAAPHNAKCERYFTRERDGLLQSWAGERVWCNPPYSDIAPWVEKAWAESLEANGIVMLLPANRCEQGWWQRLVEPHRIGGAQHHAWRAGDNRELQILVRFLPGRMRFIRPNAVIGPKGDRPPFGCCLLIWPTPDGSFPRWEGDA